MNRPLLAPLAMGSMIVIIAILSLGAYGDTGGDWIISDHVILEDENMLLEENITVVSGGWLDLRGTTLTFNNTRPGEYILQVLDEGRLTTSRSASGADCVIRSSDPLNQTQLYANWASGISLEHLRMVKCGYAIYVTLPEIYPAVYIANTDGVIIRDSEFFDNVRTLNLQACRRVTIEGCRIENPTGTAISLAFSSEVVVEDNTIVGGKTGISVSMSTNVVIKNNIVEEGSTGIGISRSDGVTVTGNQILVVGRYGCALDRAKLCILEGNTFKGVLTYYSTNTGTRLRYSSFVTVRQNSYENLTSAIEVWDVNRFGQPYNHISRVEVSNCTVGIHLASAYNTVSNVTITGADTGILIDDEYSYSKAEPTGNTVIGSLIENCILGMSIVNSTGTTLRSNTFRSNIDDIQTRASWDVLEENGSHSGWEGCAIAAYGGDLRAVSTVFSDGGCAIVQGMGITKGSTVTIEQSVLVDVSTTVVSTGGSRLVLINSTHPRVYDVDTNSSVEVYWDVEVSVRLASEPGRRLSGSLEVSDIELIPVFEASFDITDGPVKAVLLELVVSNADTDNRTPHTFRAETMGRNASLVENITRFTRITILIDDVPPTIEVLSPATGEHNTSNLLLSGSAKDEQNGPVDIEVQVDGIAEWNGQDSWNFSVPFEDGPHRITLIATDAHGNTVTVELDVVVDTTPPSLEITHPPGPDHRTREPDITLTGSIKDAVELTVNGAPVAMYLGLFRSKQLLSIEGVNAFEVWAVDGLGNSVSVVLSIVKDTTAPRLTVGEYPALTRDLDLSIHGMTDADATSVTLDGESVATSPGGEFQLELVLVEGINSFDLRATDDLGNTNSTRILVELDTVAHIEIITPVNGTVFEVQDIEILVLVEPGAKARVKDGEWHTSDPDGYARINVSLHLDETTLVLETEDIARNEGLYSITVYFSPPKQTGEDNTMLIIGFIVGLVVIGTVALLVFRSQAAR